MRCDIVRRDVTLGAQHRESNQHLICLRQSSKTEDTYKWPDKHTQTHTQSHLKRKAGMEMLQSQIAEGHTFNVYPQELGLKKKKKICPWISSDLFLICFVIKFTFKANETACLWGRTRNKVELRPQVLQSVPVYFNLTSESSHLGSSLTCSASLLGGGCSVLIAEYCTMYLSVCLCFPPACLSLSCSGNTVKWRGCQGAVPTVPACSLWMN